MVKFAELLEQHSDEDIVDELLALFPDEEVSVDGYFIALSEIRALEPVDSEITIVVEMYEDDFTGEEYADVSGTKLGETMGYAIEFTAWEEWLGMECAETDKFSGVAFLAHCLYEMTFTGYTNKEVQTVLADIMADSEECREALESDDESVFAPYELTLDDFECDGDEEE